MAIYAYTDPRGNAVAINLGVIVGIQHLSGKNSISVLTHGDDDKRLRYPDPDTAQAEYLTMLGLMDT